MASFKSSSNITITGGKFTTYEGDRITHVYGNLVQCGHPEQEQEKTESEQYRLIPTGKVCLQRTIADTVVERDDVQEWGSLKARRRVSVARIDGEDSEFLHIGYRGPDAIKAYQKDFEEFSLKKNVNSVQLFGYNDWNKLPALVFYDAPVPFANILENNKFSPILRAYVEYQATQALNEIWIEPHSGALRKGPFVNKSLPDEWPLHIFGLRSNATALNDRPFLPLKAYHDPNIVLEYLTRLLPARDILRGIGWQWKLTQKPASFEESVNLLSSLPGTIHRRDNQDVVARWPGDNGDWYYGQSRLQGSIREVMQEKKVLDDGSVR
ncbi:hypothetical protein VNI00_017939 [Paramarasmius palmivorus]|uniref:Uncharacterized protein n=1 Tax=Paramarasmius palmivorus TaxID=297713 RepID=A0AAW0B180_9AGAR